MKYYSHIQGGGSVALELGNGLDGVGLLISSSRIGVPLDGEGLHVLRVVELAADVGGVVVEDNGGLGGDAAQWVIGVVGDVRRGELAAQCTQSSVC